MESTLRILWKKNVSIPFHKEQEYIYHNQTNTLFYREIFGCYPDDTILSLKDLHKLKVKPNIETYEKEKEKVQGFVVEYPLYFLKDEDLLEGSTLYPHALSV